MCCYSSNKQKHLAVEQVQYILYMMILWTSSFLYSIFCLICRYIHWENTIVYSGIFENQIWNFKIWKLWMHISSEIFDVHDDMLQTKKACKLTKQKKFMYLEILFPNFSFSQYLRWLSYLISHMRSSMTSWAYLQSYLSTYMCSERIQAVRVLLLEYFLQRFPKALQRILFKKE